MSESLGIKSLDFLTAYERAKVGCQVSRLAWGGKNTYLFAGATIVPQEGQAPIPPVIYVGVDQPQGQRLFSAPWQPNAEDLVAKDWIIIG